MVRWILLVGTAESLVGATDKTDREERCGYDKLWWLSTRSGGASTRWCQRLG